MTTSALFLIGVILFFIGAIVMTLGKTLIILRWFFGDRSMFSQIMWGLLLICVGIVLIVIGSR